MYDCAPRFVLEAHQFTGKERDGESGLVYFPARSYSSTMGRWMSPDPSGLYFAILKRAAVRFSEWTGQIICGIGSL